MLPPPVTTSCWLPLRPGASANTPERLQRVIEGAQKFRERWEVQRTDLTVTQEATLLCRADGCEVRQLTSAQAVVGNKVIYRNSLGM